MLQVCNIHHLYLWQLNTLVTLRQRYIPIFPRLRIIVGLHARRCGTKKRFSAQHNSCASCMIPWHRILLFIRGFMFLVYDDKTQALERQEYSTAGTKDNIIRIIR